MKNIQIKEPVMFKLEYHIQSRSKRRILDALVTQRSKHEGV